MHTKINYNKSQLEVKSNRDKILRYY